MSKKRNKARRRRIIKGLIIGIVIAFVVIGLFLLIYEGNLFAGENGQILNNSLGDKIETGDNVDKKVGNETSENILICGLDESEQLTDVIMIINIDYGKNTVNVLQIPRDTYIEKGTGSTNKINSAYSNGDKELTPINRLISVINEQYKIKINHYATINLTSFRDVVDAIGGVPIDIPYNIGNSQYGIIYKGYQVLDGEHAEWLVRHRHTYADQDLGRIKIQRLFLASVIKQVKAMGMSKVMKVAGAVFGNFTTDMSLKQVQSYAKIGFNMDMENMTFFMIPGEGTTTSNGQSVYSMHLLETADLLNAYFRPYGEMISASELGIKEIAHTGEYYENTENSVEGLVDGEQSGKKNDDPTLPTYTHVVTQKPYYTTSATVLSKETTTPVATDEVYEKTYPKEQKSETSVTPEVHYGVDEKTTTTTEESVKVPDKIEVPKTSETTSIYHF